jgi:hypothetical protein
MVAASIEELRPVRPSEDASHAMGLSYPAGGAEHQGVHVPQGHVAVSPAASPFHDATIILLVSSVELTWFAALAYGIWLLFF